jgi:zinc protease
MGRSTVAVPASDRTTARMQRRRLFGSSRTWASAVAIALPFNWLAGAARTIEPPAAPPPAADSLPRDPALTVGTLPNGIRYYVRTNKSPANRALLRLVVHAGSVQEDEDQQGFAHFLEHMAFNGTTHFPRHELISTLELAGMHFGADVNAYTSFDETVYMLEVPTDDGKSLRQGLTMMEDWADGGMLIDSAEVLAERGVVLGEWRTRMPDTLSKRLQSHQDSVLFGTTRYSTRSPIGLPSLISAAQPEPLRRFYRDWYRPDLMAVVVVGDIDARRVEQEIKRRFGAIPPARRPRKRESPSLPASGEPAVDVLRAPVYPSASVLWREPPRPIVTKEAYRRRLAEQLLFEALQRRYLRMGEQERRPFVAASASRTGLQRVAEANVLQVVAYPDSLEEGLAQALAEIERIARHGVPEPSLDRQKAALVKRLEGAVASEAARPSALAAQAYTTHYLTGDGSTLLTPSQELALARELLPSITAKDLAQAAGFWRRRTDVLILYHLYEWAHVRVPTRESILAILDSVARLEIAPDSVAQVAEAPLLATSPQPGRVVSELRHRASGVTEWKLSNGARVLFKTTPFDPDELMIGAMSPGGTGLLPDTLFFSSGRMVAEMMTQAAGVGSKDRSAIEQQLVTTGLLREFAVSLTPTQESMRLVGSPKDLEALFQLLYLQFTQPKLDTTALSLWKRVGSPGGFSSDDFIDNLLSGGNPRLTPPSPAMMPLADTATAMAVYRDRFGNAGDFTFIIVGAAAAQQVRPLVERYVASLPSTQEREKPVTFGVIPWNQLVRQTQSVYDIPKASSQVLFDGLFPSEPREYLGQQRLLNALTSMLRLKFTETLREHMGGTYGVGVQAWTLPVPEEHYRFSVQFDAAPERIDEMSDSMFAIIQRLRTDGATPVELKKVAAMQRREREAALTNNGFWLKTLSNFDRLGIPVDSIVTPAVAPTVADIRTGVERYLPMQAYIHVTAMPADTLLWKKADSTEGSVSQASAQPGGGARSR